MQAGAAIAIPFTVACSKDDDTLEPGDEITIDLDAAEFSALKSAGGSVKTQGIIVANTGNDEFVALSSICTHAGCTINYNHSNTNFPCPCHGSVFSVQGSVVQGPATVPVRKYDVTRENNILTIKG